MKHIFKTWQDICLLIFLTILLIFIIAIGFYFYNSIKTTKLELKNAPFKLSGQQYDAWAGDHYWIGTDKAPITIVEFGDFACPACEQSFLTIREISLKYKNDIKFIWRDYPVVAEYSALLALAGHCAGEQGLFWPMHDKLFQNQGVSTTDQLTALANQAGADTVRFKDCLIKQKYLSQIQKDLSDGQTFGNTGTPTWFINGHKVAGDIPYETFIYIIKD
ncbi:DsbA family protein, partial [Patescibacteria group bacterium]|nr:DsbA family protein [Patescibacteria group bacterium]MBU1663743.1 DsbA family protein [Patescibacteria group bacterium]